MQERDLRKARISTGDDLQTAHGAVLIVGGTLSGSRGEAASQAKRAPDVRAML